MYPETVAAARSTSNLRVVGSTADIISPRGDTIACFSGLHVVISRLQWHLHIRDANEISAAFTIVSRSLSDYISTL